MSDYNPLEDLYGADVEDAAEDNNEVIDISRPMTIDTALFTITFKKFSHNGNQFNPARSMVASDVFGFVDKLVVQIAMESIKIRQLVCGDEALADDLAPMIQDLFQPTGQLKAQYVGTLTDIQLAKLEGQYCQIVGMVTAVTEMAAQRAEFFPSSRKEIQYAWDNTKREGIYDLKQAISYRINTGLTLQNIKKRVAARRSGKKDVLALRTGSAAAILGF